jgi:hypothetical protein
MQKKRAHPAVCVFLESLLSRIKLAINARGVTFLKSPKAGNARSATVARAQSGMVHLFAIAAQKEKGARAANAKIAPKELTRVPKKSQHA